jgi:hypothetical protein
LTPSSLRKSRLACLFAALLFLTYGCFLAGKSVAGFPTSQTTHTRWPWLGDKPVGEDGFYMLTVADNLAVKHHLVYNQDMPATGIQPLATVFFALIALTVHHLGGDRWTLVRAVILFGTALFVSFAWMLASIAARFAPATRRDLVFALAFFLTLSDFAAFRLFTYGLETGIYLCLIALCVVVWRRVVAEHRAAWIDMLLLGVIAGFAGLARIDFGFLFFVLLAYLLFQRIASVLQVLAAGFIALAVVSPWFLFVHRVSGDWLPSSGKAEGAYIGARTILRAHGMVVSVMAHLVPWSFAGSGNGWTGTLAEVCLVGIVIVFWRAAETRLAMRSFNGLSATVLPWLGSLCLMALVYMTFFASIHFYVRYLSPILAVWIPLLALGLSELRFVQRHRAILPVMLSMFFCLWAILSLHTGHVGSTQLVNAGYIRTNYPSARVGSFQSGVVGYFNPNVENLDGKLNEGALRAVQKHQLDTFVESEHISVLVDWRGYITNWLPTDYLSREWQACPQAMVTANDVCLLHR